MGPNANRPGDRRPGPANSSGLTTRTHGSSTDRLADSRRRAAAAALVLREMSTGRWPADPAILAALGTLAGRVAVDLAIEERDRSLEAAA